MRIRKEAHIINVKRSKSFYCINYYYFAFDEVCMCVAFAQKLMLVNVEEPAMPTAKMNVADVHKSTTIFFSLFLVLPLFKRNNKKKVKIPRGKIYTRMAEKKKCRVSSIATDIFSSSTLRLFAIQKLTEEKCPVYGLS